MHTLHVEWSAACIFARLHLQELAMPENHMNRGLKRQFIPPWSMAEPAITISCTASSLSLMCCLSVRGWATQLRSRRPPKGVLVWSISHSREPFSLPSSLLRRTSSCLCPQHVASAACASEKECADCAVQWCLALQDTLHVLIACHAHEWVCCMTHT